MFLITFITWIICNKETASFSLIIVLEKSSLFCNPIWRLSITGNSNNPEKSVYQVLDKQDFTVHLKVHGWINVLILCYFYFQGIMTIFYLWVGGIYVLINFTSFIEALFITLTIAALLYLRIRAPKMERPIKVKVISP